MRRLIPLGVAAAGAAVVVFGISFLGTSQAERLDQIARANCLQVEALKSEFRKQAMESFMNLDRNARLLGIEVTPEVRAEALAGRNRTLARFAARECN